jgi:hypothetical protein
MRRPRPFSGLIPPCPAAGKAGVATQLQVDPPTRNRYAASSRMRRGRSAVNSTFKGEVDPPQNRLSKRRGRSTVTQLCETRAIHIQPHLPRWERSAVNSTFQDEDNPRSTALSKARTVHAQFHFPRQLSFPRRGPPTFNSALQDANDPRPNPPSKTTTICDQLCPPRRPRSAAVSTLQDEGTPRPTQLS